MIRKTLFLPTVRPQMMQAFLDSLKFLDPSWDLLVAFQAYTKEDFELVKKSPYYYRITDYMIYPERRFPYPTRVEMYKKWRNKYDFWCSMDDDMELLATVNYGKILEKLQEPGVGVVSGNWVKHETFLKRIQPVNEFVEQPLVNMAGGQMFGREIVDILITGKVAPYRFCDIEVAIKAYVKGYRNFRYRGSLIIHRIMAKDGLIKTVREYPMELPDSTLIVPRMCDSTGPMGPNYFMPGSKEVTKYAHELHTLNLKQH